MQVALVMGSPSSEMAAPFHDENCKIWVLGARYEHKWKEYPRVDRIFEVHDEFTNMQDPVGYPKWLADKGIPMVVGEEYPIKAEHITVFPFEEAEKLRGRQYLTSSAAYMLAMAMIEGYDEIGIFGCDMSVANHEYFKQRACMENWLGFAEGRGLSIYVPNNSPLGKSKYVYGKKRDKETLFSQGNFELLAQQHRNKINQMQLAKKQIEDKILIQSGAERVIQLLSQVARGSESGQDIKNLTDGIILGD